MMPGPTSAISAKRRFTSGSSGGNRGAVAGTPARVRSSAPWPPMLGSSSGENNRSSSLTGRPLTKATAPPVKSQSRGRSPTLHMVAPGSERHAAVDQMRLAGNVARLVRGQKEGERGDLLRLAEPAHGLALDEGALDLLQRFAGRL